MRDTALKHLEGLLNPAVYITKRSMIFTLYLKKVWVGVSVGGWIELRNELAENAAARRQWELLDEAAEEVAK